MRGADLRGADLSYADLSDADLSDADLGIHWIPPRYGGHSGSTQINIKNLPHYRRTYLRRANLSRADLSSANLNGADLSSANLNGAVGLTDDQLRTAKYLEGATMPDGQKYEDWLKDKGGQDEE